MITRQLCELAPCDAGAAGADPSLSAYLLLEEMHRHVVLRRWNAEGFLLDETVHACTQQAMAAAQAECGSRMREWIAVPAECTSMAALLSARRQQRQDAGEVLEAGTLQYARRVRADERQLFPLMKEILLDGAVVLALRLVMVDRHTLLAPFLLETAGPCDLLILCGAACLAFSVAVSPWRGLHALLGTIGMAVLLMANVYLLFVGLLGNPLLPLLTMIPFAAVAAWRLRILHREWADP